MDYGIPYPLPARAIPAWDTMSAAQRLRPRVAKSRTKIAVPKRGKRLSTESHGALAAANHVKPSSELVATRVWSQRAVRTREAEMAALCRRHASRWADAIREGLDPDIARFIRDQAAAWRLLATAYARSAGDSSIGPADA
jgi:hypothetical protein